MKLVSNSQRILYELFIQEYRDNAASCIWKSLSTLGVRHAILINAVTRDRSAVQALKAAGLVCRDVTAGMEKFLFHNRRLWTAKYRRRAET